VQPAVAFSEHVEKAENKLDDSHIFIGFNVRGKLRMLLDDGTITPKQHNDFLSAARAFHVQGVLYALKWLPVDDDILKHAVSLVRCIRPNFPSTVLCC